MSSEREDCLGPVFVVGPNLTNIHRLLESLKYQGGRRVVNIMDIELGMVWRSCRCRTSLSSLEDTRIDGGTAVGHNSARKGFCGRIDNQKSSL